MDKNVLENWWLQLDQSQQIKLREIADKPTPRAMAIDDLVVSMTLAGIPTARQIWTGQPESLAEMLDEVAEFVLAQYFDQ